jgi:Protein of unknown function (DUF3551)
MRLSLIIVGAFAAIVSIEKPAAADNGRQWCAYYVGSEATNCGWDTYEQCLATVSGIGGFCPHNTMYQPPPRPPSLTRHPRHHPL